MLAQDAVNKAFQPIVFKLNSIGDDRGATPIQANYAPIGEGDRGATPIQAKLASIGETVSIHHTGQVGLYGSA